MRPLLILVVAVATLAGCATDPGRRAKVAQEESVRLAAPTTPLSSYGTLELKPMEMAPEVANDSAKAAVAKDLDARMQARMQPVLAQWTAQGSSSAAAGRTLIVQPRVMKIRVIGGATRFFAGALAGDSSIDMDLELKEAATGTVIAKPRIVRNANAMAGTWSVGATDRNLLTYIADIATQYLHDNHK